MQKVRTQKQLDKREKGTEYKKYFVECLGFPGTFGASQPQNHQQYKASSLTVAYFSTKRFELKIQCSAKWVVVIDLTPGL